MSCSSFEKAVELAAALMASGCSISYQKGDADLSLDNIKDSVLVDKFTPEAQRVLKDVPVKIGYVPGRFSGWTSGNNPISTLASLLLIGEGDTAIIVSNNNPGIDNLVHEFLHAADNKCLLPDDFMDSVWEPLSKNQAYHKQVRAISHRITNWKYRLLFFLGLNSPEYELRAYVGGHFLSRPEVPEEVRAYYKNVLRFSETQRPSDVSSPKAHQEDKRKQYSHQTYLARRRSS